MKRCSLFIALMIGFSAVSVMGETPPATAPAGARFTWTGMRAPCKLSGEDGLNQKQLGKKIGTFMAISDPQQWATAITAVQSRFPKSKPWVTWTVGDMRDATTQPDSVHEANLSNFDKLGVVVMLELAPINKNIDVPAAIDSWLGKFKSHRCIAGLSVDLEFYKKVDDATAKAWDEKIKSHNGKYRLMLKHWDASYLPATYRGDMIFCCTSSEESIEALNVAFADWAGKFAPSAVAFQFGYPTEEDGMDGTAKTGWWKLDDPIKNWGDALLAQLKDPKQEVGLIWVCAKSGKTYNAKWDLTKAK